MRAPRPLPATLGELLAAVCSSLPEPGEAALLTAAAAGIARETLYAHPERAVTAAAARRGLALAARRGRGEPVAYLLGEREFFGLRLTVAPGALIPRPETELAVELALAAVAGLETPRIVDAGTGSGAIALALARERPDATVVAVEREAPALAIAAANRRRLGLGRVYLVGADWLAPLASDAFDLVVSNPPYVAAGDPHLARGDLRFEPLSALAAGADGLQALRAVLPAAAACLRPGGTLVVEHGADQQEAVLALARAAGLEQLRGHADLAGLPRAVTARRGA